MSSEKHQNKKWAFAAVSRDGVRTALRAARFSGKNPDVWTLEKYASPGTKIIPGKLTDFWETLMADYDVIVCVMAAGIAVRGIAPHIRHKSVDPAVLVMDSGGQYVISLLSGHLGGANEAAVDLAKRIDAKPVITTGTDVKGSMAVDVLAEKLGCVLRDFSGAKDVTAAILDDSPVGIINEADLSFDGIVLPWNVTLTEDASKFKAVIVISDKAAVKNYGIPQVQLIPKTIVAGIGCKKGTPAETIEKALDAICAGADVNPWAVARFATIGLKAGEKGIHDVCDRLGAEMTIVEDNFVKMVQSHFDGSDFVEKTTGLRAVSEPCGYVASGFGDCIAPVQKGNGVTLSLWKEKK